MNDHGTLDKGTISLSILTKRGENPMSLGQEAGGNMLKSAMDDCIRFEFDETHPFSTKEKAVKSSVPTPDSPDTSEE